MQLTESQREVYRRYAGLALPRHTSYPAAPFWREYDEGAFRSALERSDRRNNDLSLYVHVPFCERLCYYCTCTKEIMPRRADGAWLGKTAGYMERVEHEIASVARCVSSGRVVRQIHLGGGTPTYLSSKQLSDLTACLRSQFHVSADAEISVELDPRVTSQEQLHALRELGFNRVSLGVQDFDPRVQSAVNRVQPRDLVEEFVCACRKLGFHSINFDLIYGLPFQTPESVDQTIRKSIELAPDRVAFYRMAVIPELFRWQNVFRPEDLPDMDATCEMFLAAIEAFEAAAYRFVGLDHFAKPNEGLASAEERGTMRRTFQGMTTGGGLDLLGFGPSAISILEDAFAQNAKTVHDWSTAIDQRRLATFRGLDLSQEDLLRQSVLEQLYCTAEIDRAEVGRRFGICFNEHFADELDRLDQLNRDGLIELADSRILLTFPLGRLLMRVPAAVFDAYLPRDCFRQGQQEVLASRVG